jgi:hypothetical protein
LEVDTPADEALQPHENTNENSQLTSRPLLNQQGVTDSDNSSSTNNANPNISCPKCGGKDFEISHEVIRKGYGGGKACCGALALGPFGLLCGMCGKNKVKAEKVYWICKTCGNVFTAEVKERVSADGTKTFETQYSNVSADDADDTSWKTGWSAVLKARNIGAVIVSFVALLVLYNVCEYGAFDLFPSVLEYNFYVRNDASSFIKSLIIFFFVAVIPAAVATLISRGLAESKKAKGLAYISFAVFYTIRFCYDYSYYEFWLPNIIPLGFIAFGYWGLALEEIGILKDGHSEDDEKTA